MKTILKSLFVYGLFVVACFGGEDERKLYSGSITIPALGELGMFMSVVESEMGTTLLMTVPSQGAVEIPLQTTHNKNGELIGELQQSGIVFTVVENEDYSKLTGSMQQSEFTFDIDFQRVDKLPELNRPQNPIEPYPYGSREVTVLHPEGHLLAGTLTIPEGVGPFPCAILISGSGQQDRDESLMGHKPFLVISDYLTRSGIAVLRYDDRGVGGSVMENIEDVLGDTSQDFASDSQLMVEAARMHPEVDARRVGVIGHSEGGLIGPMVAVEDSKLAFVVMLAGPGISGMELLPLQQARILEASGASQEMIDALVNVNLSVFELILADASEEELIDLIEEAVQLTVELDGAIDVEMTNEVRAEIGQQIKSPWLRFFLEHEPMAVLVQVKCPVLAMNGTLDLQVPSRENLSVIEEVMINASRDITIVELEGLNHLFQPAETGAISEYTTIELTFDENALRIMKDWIIKVTDND